MKSWTWLWAICFVLSALWLPFQSVQADEQGWGLMIKSPHVGIVYLYITSEGFALVIKQTGAKFVTHAPDWRLVMYNDKTQVYYVERLSDLQTMTTSGKGKRTQQAMRKAAMQNARTGKTDTIAGLQATQYFINTYSQEGGARQAEVWITKQIRPPEQLHKTFEKLFGIDMSRGQFPDGLPLRIKLADDAGKRELVYDTMNCQKQVIHTASFTYPSTYKRVDNELAVLMDEKSRQKMESILDDSDDISTLLGSSTTTSKTPARSAMSTGSNYRPVSTMQARPFATTPYRAMPVPARPTPTAAPKAQNNDWWSGMINTLGGGHK